MKVATAGNTDARLHVAELLAVIDDSLRFGNLDGETRYFCATAKDRLRADLDYLVNNLCSRELPVRGYEAYSGSVDTWAS